VITISAAVSRNEQSIVLKDLGFVHARQARNDHLEKDQDHVGGVVVGPRGSVPENTLQSAAQAQLLTKPLDQKQTAEVGERVRFELKIQCLQALSHFADNKKLPLGAAPITVQNRRLLARGQNVTFCPASKPFGEILSLAHAFLRLKRWAILEHPSGMRMKSWWHWTGGLPHGLDAGYDGYCPDAPWQHDARSPCSPARDRYNGLLEIESEQAEQPTAVLGRSVKGAMPGQSRSW